jgi:hypothetical protein
MSKQDTAQLIAGVLTVLFVLGLARMGRRDLVAMKAGSYTRGDGTTVSMLAGEVIPSADAALAQDIPSRLVRRSALGAVIVGKDRRTSTSKTIAFAWTLAIGWGLLSLVIADVLGDAAEWTGLQEEYLLLLGGPYAAAVLAKYATSSQAESKPDGAVGGATPGQLVNDDEGDTDLGDLQYVLFNVIGLAYFLSQFIGELGEGFPDLPPTLTGLMLTSTGGYAAKKLLAQSTPTLSSVVPAAAPPQKTVQVFGVNLGVPTSMADGGDALKPTVLIGAEKAAVIAHDVVLGNDRLTVRVPPKAKPGSAPVSVTRADGVPARDARGVGLLPFDVLAPVRTSAKPSDG